MPPYISAYRERKIRRNMLTTYARTSAVLPDMAQTEKERGESHEWAHVYAACTDFLLNYIQWNLSLFKSIFFIDIHF